VIRRARGNTYLCAYIGCDESTLIAPGTVEPLRLRGERLTAQHLDLWVRMGKDPRLTATLGRVWTEAHAREKPDWNLRQWGHNGHGHWLFFLKDSARLIGRGGARKMAVDAREEVELGYAVMPGFWGQGLATEMGATSLQGAFDQLRYPSVVAFTLLTNRPSERVRQKRGFGKGHFPAMSNFHGVTRFPREIRRMT
jgi:RimJ/RimL family protein N-acetyltransferase